MMRRVDRKVGTDEALKFLSDGEYGVLSLCCENNPYGIPLNYCVIENNIYFHCAVEGKKIEYIAKNPNASFCVVKSAKILPDKFATFYESVIVFGKINEVCGAEKKGALVGLIKKYSSEYIESGVEYIERLIDVTKVFRLSIEDISGKARR
ncbi:MAG: pyridoxamine 5'-phosphate oxidase family protein [Deferribacterales bacterium]|nr:pyridoxamine 5'-phosphate oxidase family protein [Deferribacterales bacterium]